MKAILNYLATDGYFLFSEGKCRIVDSTYCPGFGGTGTITLQNELLRLIFQQERDNLLLDFQSVKHKLGLSKGSFSFGLIRQLITGEIDKEFQPVIIDPHGNWMRLESYKGGSDFLQHHFQTIQSLFDNFDLVSTEAALKTLEKKRVKRLFG